MTLFKRWWVCKSVTTKNGITNEAKLLEFWLWGSSSSLLVLVLVVVLLRFGSLGSPTRGTTSPRTGFEGGTFSTTTRRITLTRHEEEPCKVVDRSWVPFARLYCVMTSRQDPPLVDRGGQSSCIAVAWPTRCRIITTVTGRTGTPAWVWCDDAFCCIGLLNGSTGKHTLRDQEAETGFDPYLSPSTLTVKEEMLRAPPLWYVLSNLCSKRC